MAKVGILMGSDSDMPVMAKAAAVLDELGVSYEMHIISAHREVDEFFAYAKTAEERGLKVIIAGAGMAAHLPGMCAAIDAYDVSRGQGFPLLDRSDAERHPGRDSRDQRRSECCSACCKDPCRIG